MSYTEFDFPHTHFYDSDLRELLKYVKELWDRVNKLDSWKNTHEEEYEELKKLYDDIVSGNFPEEMYKSLYNWVVTNSASIIAELTKMVFFGITDDGYFVAYIPDTWDDIIFGTTGLDDFPAGVEYGHLTLSY
jgi:hypothetical protein